VCICRKQAKLHASLYPDHDGVELSDWNVSMFGGGARGCSTQRGQLLVVGGQGVIRENNQACRSACTVLHLPENSLSVGWPRSEARGQRPLEMMLSEAATECDDM